MMGVTAMPPGRSSVFSQQFVDPLAWRNEVFGDLCPDWMLAYSIIKGLACRITCCFNQWQEIPTREVPNEYHDARTALAQRPNTI